MGRVRMSAVICVNLMGKERKSLNCDQIDQGFHSQALLFRRFY